jgi:hypothetical protein
MSLCELSKTIRRLVQLSFPIASLAVDLSTSAAGLAIDLDLPNPLTGFAPHFLAVLVAEVAFALTFLALGRYSTVAIAVFAVN